MPTIPLKERSRLPRKPGIYWVMSGGQVIYVGKANNLRDRWSGTKHEQYYPAMRHRNPRIKYRLVPKYRLRFEEAKDIQRFRSQITLNRQFPNPKEHYFPFPFLADLCWAIGSLGFIFFLIRIR